MLNRIKKLCKEKNIAYKDLSDMTGISISTLGKIMSEVIKEPSIVTVSKIAQALDVSVDYLIYGEQLEIIKQKEEQDLIDMYNELNFNGKTKLLNYIFDLLEIKKYTIEKFKDVEECGYTPPKGEQHNTNETT